MVIKLLSYCDNPLCENEAVKTVPVSEHAPSDSIRRYCAVCEEAYSTGVQHGRLSENPNAYQPKSSGKDPEDLSIVMVRPID